VKIPKITVTLQLRLRTDAEAVHGKYGATHHRQLSENLVKAVRFAGFISKILTAPFKNFARVQLRC
jgi:hypothetical protein